MNKNTILLFLFVLLFVKLNAQDSIEHTGTTRFYNDLDISSNNDFSSFHLIGERSNQYKVYILGENHQFKSSNIDLRIKIFKYLHQYAGVRIMLLEQGFSWGWLMNEYIQTGDSLLLSILNKYSWSPYARLFKELYEYNRNLDSSNKIKIVGIDVERFFGLSVRTLSYLFPEEKAPDDISLHVESIKGLAAYNDNYIEENLDGNNHTFSNYSDYSAENIIDEFIVNFYQYRETYMNFLAENYPVFEKIVHSLEAKKQYSNYDELYMTQAYVFREQYMLKEFISVFKEFPNEKYYGQLGRCHANLLNQKEACSWYDFNSIATRMNNLDDSLVKGKVCTIGAFYPKGHLRDDIKNEIKNLNTLINLSNSEGLTLFKVDSNNGLFEDLVKKYQYIIINNTELEEWEVAMDDYYDYEFKHKDSTKILSYYFDFGYGYRYVNFKDLNKVFEEKGIDKFNRKVNFYSFGMTFCINHSFYYAIEGFYSPKIERNIGDTLQLDFTGNGFAIYLGGDLIRSKYFHVVPRLGFGYAEFNLLIEKDENLNQDTFFGDNVYSMYKNPGYFLDFSIDSRIKLKLISLGIKGGYILDLSKKNWKAGKILNKSPRTPISGFYIGLNASVFFDN
ncbi:hypothetical protein ACFL6I_27280 [candidate division KSB1 bacterium]